MSRFCSPSIKNVTPYTPGEQIDDLHLIKLNTNENPFSPSPLVLDALKDEMTNGSLHLYPDPESQALKKCIADYYEIVPEQVFLGNGSDEVLAHTFLSFFKQNSPLLFPDITYSFYTSYCSLYGIDYKKVPLQNYKINIGDYKQTNGGIIFPNPNAPTGSILTVSEIEKLLSINTESIFVVDEAYVDFGGESSVRLIDKYPNLLVIQTLSKSRSLAGMRVGFAMGNSKLINTLNSVKNSFNSYPIDRLSSVAAIAAFQDKDYFNENRQLIINNREWLKKSLLELNFEVLPSEANFLFVSHPKFNNGLQLTMKLREKNILVRHFNAFPIERFLRISIGTQQQCTYLVESLKEIMFYRHKNPAIAE